MSTTIKATTTISFGVTETPDATGKPFISSVAQANVQGHNAGGGGGPVAYNGTTTPAGTMVADFELAMTSGAATIDLTATPDGKNASGLKLRAIYILNPAANANPISIVGGASNGYLLFGTGGKENLYPGEDLAKRLKDSLPAIDSSHKTIDIAGTGTQKIQVLAIFG